MSKKNLKKSSPEKQDNYLEDDLLTEVISKDSSFNKAKNISYLKIYFKRVYQKFSRLSPLIKLLSLSGSTVAVILIVFLGFNLQKQNNYQDDIFYSYNKNSEMKSSGFPGGLGGDSRKSESAIMAYPDLPSSSMESSKGSKSSLEASSNAPAPDESILDSVFDSVKDKIIKPEDLQERQARAGLLTAGEWNDLENRDFWEDLMQREYGEFENPENQEKSKTFADLVRKWGIDEKEIFNHPSMFQTKPELNKNELDIAFIVDTTGSMSDELEFLKEELKDVIKTVKYDKPNLDIRIATVFYRDEGDEYVVKKFGFRENIQEVVNKIKEQEAGGGGDFPEAVDFAFEEAVDNLEWREGAANKMIFWIADAPLHQETQKLDSFNQSLDKAANNWINVFPIASSGIDKETEMLMRATAIKTQGSYIFLTDDSGIGNSHIEPTVGEYEVEFLNNLLVRVINEKVSVQFDPCKEIRC